MLKVLAVVDKENTAIDRLAQGMKRYMSNIDYQVIAVHPKRPDQNQLATFEEQAIEADLIDWQYFRTAEMLRSRYSWLASKKQILAHHNPYSISESDWNSYDLVIANNRTIFENLKKITSAPLELVPNTIDSDFWTFNNDWEPTKNVIMVANRIESKKGILPVAIACGDLGLKLILVGSVSDPEYMMSIEATGAVEFHEQITDEALKRLYYKSSVHVCNSIDNFESGTLPMLEAMLCGVPVLTRRIGQVPELANGENMIVHEGSPEDVGRITELLKSMIFDKKKLESMRNSGWSSAKARSNERRAYAYQKLYRQILFPEQVPVSVIFPIYDKPEIARKSLNAIAEQTYKNIEIVIADDNPESQQNEQLVDEFKQYVNFPVRYLNTAKADNDYGLARARNEAVIEATGDILVFCDQRMTMNPEAIERFALKIKPRTWLYGNKGEKKEFVENFSCIYRDELILAGMFNERINKYGGQSQEIRNRIRGQGIQIEYVDEARAFPSGKSSNKYRKRSEIIEMKNRLSKMGLDG